MNYELIVNLWAIYDAGTGLIYALSGMAYYVDGSENDKLDLLRQRSSTDYATAERYELPDRFQVSYSDGTVMPKVTTMNEVYDPSAQLFEEMFKNIEANLPNHLGCCEVSEHSVPNYLPIDPLCVITMIYEDESNNCRPIITDEDREWVALQENVRVRAPLGK